jgi:hypothetical protein
MESLDMDSFDCAHGSSHRPPPSTWRDVEVSAFAEPIAILGRVFLVLRNLFEHPWQALRNRFILMCAMRPCLELLCAAILFCTLGMAADGWNQGKVLQYRQNTFSTGASTSTGSSTNGPGHTTYTLQIDGGDRIYFVERTLKFAWQKVPVLTENGPIDWRLKGKEMVIRDDRGKEFTVTIAETRLKE